MIKRLTLPHLAPQPLHCPTTSSLLTMTSNPDVPPFMGYVETTVNALRLIHAARQGVIPRITRRLNDSERRSMIKSGAVFVFSVEESGIKRWTGASGIPSRLNLYSCSCPLLHRHRRALVVTIPYRGQLPRKCRTKSSSHVSYKPYCRRFTVKSTRGVAAEVATTRSRTPATILQPGLW